MSVPQAVRFCVDGWLVERTTSAPAFRLWSSLDAGGVQEADWRAAVPAVLAGLDGQWHRFKHDPSGTVAGGTLRLGDREVNVVAKRPRRAKLARHVADLFRPARARRGFRRTLDLLARGFDCEVPLLLLERRRFGVVFDQVAVYERVPGPTLRDLPLRDLDAEDRRGLLRSVGRTLRNLADAGLGHFDAKSVNWIAFADPDEGLRPIMIDCDGVRPSRRDRGRRGMTRFLRSLREHPDATDADAATVNEGFGTSKNA